MTHDETLAIIRDRKVEILTLLAITPVANDVFSMLASMLSVSRNDAKVIAWRTLFMSDCFLAKMYRLEMQTAKEAARHLGVLKKFRNIQANSELTIHSIR